MIPTIERKLVENTQQQRQYYYAYNYYITFFTDEWCNEQVFAGGAFVLGRRGRWSDYLGDCGSVFCFSFVFL